MNDRTVQRAITENQNKSDLQKLILESAEEERNERVDYTIIEIRKLFVTTMRQHLEGFLSDHPTFKRSIKKDGVAKPLHVAITAAVDEVLPDIEKEAKKRIADLPPVNVNGRIFPASVIEYIKQQAVKIADELSAHFVPMTDKEMISHDHKQSPGIRVIKSSSIGINEFFR